LLQRLGRQKSTRETLPQQGVPGMGMASAADARPPSGAQPSHGRRFFLIVFIFGGAQIFLVALGWVAVHAIDITRAYATGESLYSKAQNVAVLSLYRYAHAGDAADLAAFRASIAVTQGDRAAREALERPEPDREAAFAGFRQGGNNPDDIPGAVRFFLWLHRWGPFEQAIEDWREGDRLVDGLVVLAKKLQDVGPSDTATESERTRIIDEIDALSSDLATAERRFADHIGAAARAATGRVAAILGASSLVLWVLGANLAWSAYRRGIAADRRLRQSEERFSERLRQAQKMETIGNLTGGIAHDFNNLLGTIIGNIELLRERLWHDPRDADELAQEAFAAALRGAELVRQLLAFARRQPLQPKRVDADQLITACAKLLRRTLAANIEVTLDLGGDIWPILADPTQLEAAITNLATNARDAMPQGGRLTISTANAPLDAAYATQHPEVVPGDYVVIGVSDSGTGIPAAALGKIFEPFFTTKPEGRGTGLGLSMVFGFLQQSGGHINVESQESVGTIFRLYLPRAAGDALRHEMAPAPDPVANSRGESVLIVEDNAALRQIAVRQLSELGYLVHEADSASAALALIETGTPVDLLFTDIVLPGEVNGKELAKMTQARWPKIKVLLTSGFDQTKGSAAVTGGEEQVLGKPYRKADLGRALQQALGR
jgi:signal transduction histidine kinase